MRSTADIGLTWHDLPFADHLLIRKAGVGNDFHCPIRYTHSVPYVVHPLKARKRHHSFEQEMKRASNRGRIHLRMHKSFMPDTVPRAKGDMDKQNHLCNDSVWQDDSEEPYLSDNPKEFGEESELQEFSYRAGLDSNNNVSGGIET